jgi:hypothetical protein
VSEACTVLIGAADLLPALKARAGVDGEVLTFADSDALRALETISRRRPALIALERVFAVTPRGAALINRIKADPSLRQSEIRVLAHDSDYRRVVPRPPPPGAPALDRRGTRRAPRFKMNANVFAHIAGKAAVLVDLSTVGAQVVSPGALKPNQKIVVALPGDDGSTHFEADVVWTSFEIQPKSGPRYRAGLDFGRSGADAGAIAAFCERHRAQAADG